MRYLPTFFGNLALDIIPTLDNMIIKIISIGGVATIQCNHIRRFAEFQCYGVENAAYYSVDGTDPITQWIMLTPQSYTITKANYYTSHFLLIPDRYFSYVS
jgi:hypothetical protein